MNWYKKQLKLAQRGRRTLTILTPHDESEIVRLRKDENMSIKKLSLKFHTNEQRIKNILDSYGERGRTLPEPIVDSIELRNKIDQLYDLPPNGEGLPIPVISEMLGYKKSQLYYYFKKIGKHIRNRKEYIQTDFFKNQLNNMKVTDEDIEQKILELYVDEQKTSNEIAKKLNLSPTTIVRVINKYDSMRSSKEIWDVPGARKRMSDTKIKFWKEVGKLPGLLRRYKNKEDALNYLHGFRNRMGKRWGTERGFAMFNKYLPIVESLPSKLDIINDQTYPDKIKQPITTPETSQQTTASLSWYKKANKCSGWAAVVCNKTISKKVQDWGKNNISKEELTDDGRETETHVTLIYGICTDNEELVKQIFAEEGKIKASFGKVSFFSKSPDKDTVIIRVISKDLERLHKKIKKELNVETTFPIYQPHCTIAYVKNGEGRKYAGDTYFKGTKIIFDKVVFDDSKDKRTEIKLGK